MAGKHDVYVFEFQGTKARPAVAFGIAGRPFSFRNLTDFEIHLEFPYRTGLFVEEQQEGKEKPQHRTPLPIPPNSSRELHVDPNADGVYQYLVRVLRGRAEGEYEKAVGESDPIIIIDR